MRSVQSKAHADSVITAIIPLPSDPNVRRIKVGSRTVGTLRASDIETIGIQLDQPWTSSLAQQVHEAATRCTVRTQAMNLLGIRAHGRNELLTKLTRKGHEQHIVQGVLDEMTSDGWLDDEACARALAAELVQRRAASATMVREKLLTKGFDQALIDRVIADSFSKSNPIESALTLGRKKLASLKGVTSAAARRRIAATLARRGFDEDTIETVLERLGLRAQD